MEPTEPGGPADSSLAPADFNNLATPATTAEPGSQPISVNLGTLIDGSAGSMTCSGGICTAILNDTFPAGAAHRTIGLQGYFQQDIAGETVSLHTTSVTMAAAGDEARREVVDSAKCASCHEFFEGHGGNRNIGFEGGVQICTMCHNPNLSSSGRTINPANAASRTSTGLPSSATVDLGTSDTSTWPEDTNNLKDMIHGIHSSSFRTFDYEFVRGRNDGIYYNWSEVTFPAENGTRNCLLCHREDTYELPLSDDVLPTTVRTTQAEDGLDADHTAAGAARANVPNPQDWVNSPTASTCYYCHDSNLALNHMEQNGGVISIADPDAGQFTQRADLDTVESCVICHGPGKQADLKEVHGIQ
jgi:OmcA/MtrC family decaheme c-type cytochrome